MVLSQARGEFGMAAVLRPRHAYFNAHGPIAVVVDQCGLVSACKVRVGKTLDHVHKRLLAGRRGSISQVVRRRTMQRQLDHAAEGLTCAIILLLSASGILGFIILSI